MLVAQSLLALFLFLEFYLRFSDYLDYLQYYANCIDMISTT